MTVLSSRRNTFVGGVRGFTLVELMVAITLGILVSIGLVTLFGATSKANRVQEALAQLQENGRYASNRVTYDLRLESRQLMNDSGFMGNGPGTNGAVNPVLAPQVYATTIPFPDGNVVKPPTWSATMAWWPLSPRYFMQGYDCSSSCTVPTAVAPADGTPADGQRVKKSDVLLVRYMKTHGWSSYNGEVTTTCSGPILTNIVLTPVTGAPTNSPASNFQAGDLAMLTYSNGAAYIFPVGVAGTTLTPSGTSAGNVGGCSNSGNGPEVTVFNFSRDFITATYWLALKTDPNKTTRLIPTLMRTESDNKGNSTTAELVQGAEQLDFIYGVQGSDGKNRYMTADQVQASTLVTCPLPPQQYTLFIPNTMEADGCLWRAVKTIEVHVLLDSVNDMFDLTNDEMAYLYNAGNTTTYTYPGDVAPPALQVGGISFGHMMRREFVSLVSIRNFNP